MKENEVKKQIDKIIHSISQNHKIYNEQVFSLRTDSFIITEREVTEVLSGLYEELDNNQGGELRQASELLTDNFIVEVSRFCVQFVKTFSKEVDNDKQDVIYYLEKLKEMKEYFISPGDLFSNTDNLVYLGTVDYEG